LTGQSPRQLAALWRWLLALMLLAMLVWAVGRRVDHRRRPEIGVTGGHAAPLIVEPSPTLAKPEVVEQGPPRQRTEPSIDPAGAEPSRGEPVPASPSPMR